MAAGIDACAFGADCSCIAFFFCAFDDACIIDAFCLDASLSVVASDRLAGIDIDAFAAFVAVATRLIRTGLVRTWVFGFAFLIDAFLIFSAFRAGIVIDRFVDTCLCVFVADFVVRADIVSAKVFADAVDAFLVVFADIASAEIFADFVDAFLAVCASIAWIGFFVFACAILADLVCTAFGAWIFRFFAFVFAHAVHAFLIVGAHGIAAFRFALLADRIAVVTAGCECECHCGTAGKRKPSF